ncbi:hypothetical protein ACOSQ3_020928 [Xanthoceras sorbifolium]
MLLDPPSLFALKAYSSITAADQEPPSLLELNVKMIGLIFSYRKSVKEEKVEEKEESDDDVSFSLFD